MSITSIHQNNTCECLCTGVNTCQPLRGTKIRYLQDTAVGIHQHIITLNNKHTAVLLFIFLPWG